MKQALEKYAAQEQAAINDQMPVHINYNDPKYTGSATKMLPQHDSAEFKASITNRTFEPSHRNVL